MLGRLWIFCALFLMCAAEFTSTDRNYLLVAMAMSTGVMGFILIGLAALVIWMIFSCVKRKNPPPPRATRLV